MIDFFLDVLLILHKIEVFKNNLVKFFIKSFYFNLKQIVIQEFTDIESNNYLFKTKKSIIISLYVITTA